MVLIMGTLVIMESLALTTIFIIVALSEIRRNAPKDELGRPKYKITPECNKTMIMLCIFGLCIEVLKLFYTIRYILTH